MQLTHYSTLLCGVLIFSSNMCFGQERLKVSGEILSFDSVAIPYATIKVSNKSIGTYSDEKGRFSLVCNPNDSLVITSIGYKKSVITKLDENLRVFLPENISILDEIIITPPVSNTKKIDLGNSKNKSAGGFLGEYASLLKINNEREIKGDIIKVIFKLYKDQKNKDAFAKQLNFEKFQFKETLVRLLLYEKKIGVEDSLVSLIKYNITKKLRPRDKTIEFDLETLKISMPKDAVFIGIEMLGYFKDEEFIAFDSKNDISRVQQFRYDYSNKHDFPQSWTKHTIGDAWRPLLISSKGFFNFNYGIVVRGYEQQNK